MKLKYVGAKPKVSQYGVNFDQTKPDKYTFIHASLELLETLNSELKKDEGMYLHTIDTKEYTDSELQDHLQKYCPNMEEIFESREEATNELINKYRKKVENNKKLSSDERTAWLGNIDIMHDYYLQYITNEMAYNCILHRLADMLHAEHITEVTFPLGRNYALVSSHLIDILRDHKPPYDASFDVIEKDANSVGRLNMNRSKTLSS